jgi:hypothetical protein
MFVIVYVSHKNGSPSPLDNYIGWSSNSGFLAAVGKWIFKTREEAEKAATQRTQRLGENYRWEAREVPRVVCLALRKGSRAGVLIDGTTLKW